jgi:hypothetical protein
MTFESQARSYIIKLSEKRYNFGPVSSLKYSCSNHYQYIITVWCVYIFEIVSSNLYLLVLSRYITISDFWPHCELTTTINYSNPNRKYNFKTLTMRRLSHCACAMTLEIPEIDSKGQSAHLCFYLLNAFYFPVLLFYSVDACPPQRTYVLWRERLPGVENGLPQTSQG